MEGMDISLVSGCRSWCSGRSSKSNNFFGQESYREQFGLVQSDGTKKIPANWQVGLNKASQAGQIIGLLINGWAQSRFAERRCEVCREILLYIPSIRYTALSSSCDKVTHALHDRNCVEKVRRGSPRLTVTFLSSFGRIYSQAAHRARAPPWDPIDASPADIYTRVACVLLFSTCVTSFTFVSLTAASDSD